MIIEMVMNVIYSVFNFLTKPINLPEFDGFSDSIISAMEYIGMGVGVIKNFTHYSYLLTLLGVIVAIEVGIHLYTFVMFIIRKIPFIGIK